jgi:hypothetical protein|tara:strand:+ start:110 stop:355 length:246 start_codon:yes stop_codon:yes gene_type:complete
MNGFRSLHLRLRLRRADQLQAIATYDSTRTNRKTHVAELHRVAVRDYVEKRKEGDPELTHILDSLQHPDTEALIARISASD